MQRKRFAKTREVVGALGLGVLGLIVLIASTLLYLALFSLGWATVVFIVLFFLHTIFGVPVPFV